MLRPASAKSSLCPLLLEGLQATGRLAGEDPARDLLRPVSSQRRG